MTEREILEMPPRVRHELAASPAAQIADAAPASRVNRMASGLRGSSILKIAAQIRAMVGRGEPVANLTVGDFNPAEFPVPQALVDYITDALRAGETNYPPSTGMPQLRAAVAQFYADRLGLRFSDQGILIAAGARPGIYSAYRVLVDPGDRVVFPVPSWNNPEYCHLLGAKPVLVPCSARTDFLPTAAMLEPYLRGARLLVLNSPVNPTGTVFDGEVLGEICDAVLEENARRAADGWIERPLFVLYDQVYWMLTLRDTTHVHPVALRPEMAAYTVYVDAISKSFAATGVRVGWIAGPDDVMRGVADVLTHTGAWAPRAEQIATARLLKDATLVEAHRAQMIDAIEQRLGRLHDHLDAMRSDGLPVDVVRPAATIYLSARFALNGMTTPDGIVLEDDEAVRSYLLRAAGFAGVPFSAFGVEEDSGWFRLSIGAVSVAQIDAVMPRVRAALAAVHPSP